MQTIESNPNITWEEQLTQQTFTWASFRFILKAREQIFLPPYKGSALRGGFGNSFRKVCCTMRDQDCTSCLLNQSCAYAYIFETPRLENMPTQHQAANMPHPFIIEPQQTEQTEFRAGDEITFGLVLIGRSIEYLPYFVFAFDQLGSMGLGRGRGKFKLTDVYSVNDLYSKQKNRVYDGQSQTLNGDYKEWQFSELFQMASQKKYAAVKLHFVTPTRILQRNILIKELPFELYIRTLLRRLSILGRIHCGSDWDLPFADIIDQAVQTVQLAQSDLTWVNWERYSSRQKTRMNMGGFVGTVSYEGELTPFLPLILLGQFVHIGKNTTFGLGKYVIEQELWQAGTVQRF